MNRRFWTFDTLVGAFLDLFIAYFLLCGSTIALFAVKFLGLFGLSLPVDNNNGLFGNPNSGFRSLLVDYPTDKVSAVQFSASRKFPFDSVFFRAQNCNLNGELNADRGVGNECMELEGEASCGSKSDGRKVRSRIGDSGIPMDKERGFDVKGKGALNYRLRGGFRRRRKAVFDSGLQKHSSVSSSPNWITCVDQQSSNDNDSGGPDGSSIVSGANNGNYEAETPVKSDNRFEGIVFGDPQKMIPVNEADKDKMIVILTRELEESEAARSALYVELEKERNAAATAADEAMSMILRLQEDKASIEMEARQYQRMIEEKSAYDEEEMNILKEIVLRREREKHFLEKEVDAYRQMLRVENDQFNGGSNEDFTQDPEFMLHQLSMNISEKKNSKLFEDVDFPKTEEPEKTIPIVEEEKGSEVDASRVGETDSRDVHVIDNESKSTGSKKKQIDRKPSGSETSSGLPPVSGSKSSLRRNSTSALDHERTKLDSEVEWLRERLRVVQEGREKLNFSVDNADNVDNREKESVQLQLLEDIARQLQEIRMLTEPRTSRQASLPLPSSKGSSSTKKKRCRSVSVSSGHAKSS
ncbi:putative GTD-binding domain-containing protein [Helianthus annuus]|nr:putative GTD-binding domain-containing protein [Helianthus annuus]